jgi:hypothetical protein
MFGVFTTAGKVETRQAIRAQSQVCTLNGHNWTTVFVMGRDAESLREEHTQHGDLLGLSVEENMNEGNSFHYFKETLERLPCFQFYAKVDDDTAFHPARLVVRLQDEQEGTSPLFLGR